MRMKTLALFSLLTSAGILLAAAPSSPKFDTLPAPVCNNAIAELKTRSQLIVFSLMGMGPKKVWNSISNAAYALDPSSGSWSDINPVPGTAGRIGAVAAGARDHVFLFGGYVVDGQGGEQTVPDVNVYEPLTGKWFRGADIPVAVDDTIIGLYHDRYIYLVGGWSKTQPVRDVQIYDAQKNTWGKGTPIPGTPVFGHAGGLVGDTLVYVDGAYPNPAGSKPRYVPSDQCWIGKIDHHDLTKIQWTRLPAHPGPARYRTAAGGSEKDQKIYFTGGSSNPYNYNGIGYDGQPSEPSAVTFAYNVRSGKWETISESTPTPTMDHRGLGVLPDGLLVIGGMEAGQEVTNRVVLVPKQAPAK